MSSPKVTIGLAVYNGERLIRRALDSLLAQDFVDFELIISDNASTDGTAAICRDYAARDGRIRYVRQAKNLGGPGNFQFLVQEAASPYFMWAAHDDYWDPPFISANLEALEARPDCVMSVSRSEFVDESGRRVHYLAPGTYPLMASPKKNLVRFLKDAGDLSRYYGLWRTQVIQQCSPIERPVFAFDFLVLARTLKFGKHFELDQTLLHRSPDGEGSNGDKLITEYHSSKFIQKHRMLPLAWALATDPLVPRSFAAVQHMASFAFAGYRPAYLKMKSVLRGFRRRLPLRDAFYSFRRRIASTFSKAA